MSRAKEERDKAAHLRKLFEEAEKLLNRQENKRKPERKRHTTTDIQCYDKSITGFKVTQHRQKREEEPAQSTK